MSKNVFDVTIHYGNTKSVITVVANDDKQARAAALLIDAKSFRDEALKVPTVSFCEIELVADDAHVA